MSQLNGTKLGPEMTKGFSSPHILLASSNPMKMITNLVHILDQQEIDKLIAEIDRNVISLFSLGHDHYKFASQLPSRAWRQKISRLYYGVYNVRRAVVLKCEGSFSTDTSDHKNVSEIPGTINNRASHIANLRNLREDRNLSDYSHSAQISDLVISPDEAQIFAAKFIEDCRQILRNYGVLV